MDDHGREVDHVHRAARQRDAGSSRRRPAGRHPRRSAARRPPGPRRRRRRRRRRSWPAPRRRPPARRRAPAGRPPGSRRRRRRPGWRPRSRRYSRSGSAPSPSSARDSAAVPAVARQRLVVLDRERLEQHRGDRRVDGAQERLGVAAARLAADPDDRQARGRLDGLRRCVARRRAGRARAAAIAVENLRNDRRLIPRCTSAAYSPWSSIRSHFACGRDGRVPEAPLRPRRIKIGGRRYLILADGRGPTTYQRSPRDMAKGTPIGPGWKGVGLPDGPLRRARPLPGRPIGPRWVRAGGRGGGASGHRAG